MCPAGPAERIDPLHRGVRLVWLIDPRARTVLVADSPALCRILREDETLDGGDVLPGFRVPVRDILPPVEHAEA